MNRVATECQFVERHASSYLDGLADEAERSTIQQHAAVCDGCRAHLARLREVRARVQALPRRMAPAQLTVQLRVIASREQALRATRRDWRSRTRYYWQRLQLWRDNLMRPFAVPAFGGLVSTFVLFSMLTPTLWLPWRATIVDDIPTGLMTGARLKGTLIPISLGEHELTVELTVDEQGRMLDYQLASDQPKMRDEARRELENNLLFTQFAPATAFGQPVLGKIRITFRHSRIDVKG